MVKEAEKISVTEKNGLQKVNETEHPAIFLHVNNMRKNEHYDLDGENENDPNIEFVHEHRHGDHTRRNSEETP